MKFINLPKPILAAFATIMLYMPCQTLADTIVDTGPGNSSNLGGGLALNNTSFYQNLAFEFTLTNSSSITSVEGWIYEDEWLTGSLTIGIGTSPGELLFSGIYQRQEFSGIHQWTGLTGLNWYLEPGTYWASFIANTNFSGAMPGTAPQPVSRFAISHTGNPPWTTYSYYEQAVGVRILGNPPSVPDGGVNVVMLGGVLIGVAGLRRRFAH